MGRRMQAAIGAVLMALGITGAVWVGSLLGASGHTSAMAGSMVMRSMMGSMTDENSRMSGDQDVDMMDRCEAMMASVGAHEEAMMTDGISR